MGLTPVVQQLQAHEVEVLCTLDPIFQGWALLVRAKSHAAGLFVYLQSGYRPVGFQQLLYDHPDLRAKDGAGNPVPAAAPGNSKHEFGFAVDFDLSQLSQIQRAQWATLVKSLGLTWGGDFASPDPVHVESPFTLQEIQVYRKLSAWRSELCT